MTNDTRENVLAHLRCVEVYIRKVEKTVSILAGHHPWMVVQEQLATVIKMLEESPDA